MVASDLVCLLAPHAEGHCVIILLKVLSPLASYSLHTHFCSAAVLRIFTNRTLRETIY